MLMAMDKESGISHFGPTFSRMTTWISAEEGRMLIESEKIEMQVCENDSLFAFEQVKTKSTRVHAPSPWLNR